MPLELFFEGLHLKLHALYFPLCHQVLLETGVQLDLKLCILLPLRNQLRPVNYAHLCETGKLWYSGDLCDNWQVKQKQVSILVLAALSYTKLRVS